MSRLISLKRESLVWLALSVLICVPSSARATIIITAGHHALLSNTPNQKINIAVSSTAGDTVAFMDLYLEINNSYGDSKKMGTAPAITEINLNAAPTIWTAHSNEVVSYGLPFDPELPALFLAKAVFFSNTSHSVPATGIVAQLTIDTTGFFYGSSWPLNLSSPDLGETLIGTLDDPYDSVVVPGSLTIVPEPGSLAMAGVGVALLALVARRRLKRT